MDSTTFDFRIAGHDSEILEDALSRYSKLIFYGGLPGKRANIWQSGNGTDTDAKPVHGLDINVLTDDETLNLDTDESYKLNVQSPRASLSAHSVGGALRGLETFSQLVNHTRENHYLVMQASIDDFPRFKFRGFMLDSSRHFLPLSVIYQHLDAMAYSKYNVFHWHLTDDPSFPYVSDLFPELSTKGAFPPHTTHTYSREDIVSVIRYAKNRGIRVIPEFDTPGHTLSWGRGNKKLLTVCYQNDSPTDERGPVDPTLNSTWEFLKGFFGEVAQVFPDDYIHLGGDEVDFSCWRSNPHIAQWMKEHNINSYAMLEQYYEKTLLDLVKNTGKQYLIWQDVFDNGVVVQPDTVIDVWQDHYNVTMAKVTAAGYRVILSSCWYLNYISYGMDWPQYYQCEPLDFDGNDDQKKLVMGGEACMWGEYIDSTNLIAVTWPRASVVAERLWSSRDTQDMWDATVRLHHHRCRLLRRDIQAQNLDGPEYNFGFFTSFCPQEFDYHYVPPWNN